MKQGTCIFYDVRYLSYYIQLVMLSLNQFNMAMVLDLFQCVGAFCQPGTEGSLLQTFEVVSSVGFIDATTQATAVDAEQPKFTAKLPDDFFYPFT